MAAAQSNSQARKWTEDQIERELQGLARKLGHWPKIRELKELGPSGLQAAVSLHGGSQHWARKCGFQFTDQSKWTDEQIRAELAAFLEGQEVWPTGDQFKAAGLGSLWLKLRRGAGLDYWAREYRLPRKRPGRKGPRRWTDAAIRSELSRFLKGRDRWPYGREFREAGLGGLWEALAAGRGLAYWAGEFDFPAPPPGRPRPFVWTEARVRATLGPFLSGRNQWPSRKEFQEAGLEPLLRSLRRYDTVDVWAREFGIHPPRLRRR